MHPPSNFITIVVLLFTVASNSCLTIKHERPYSEPDDTYVQDDDGETLPIPIRSPDFAEEVSYFKEYNEHKAHEEAQNLAEEETKMKRFRDTFDDMMSGAIKTHRVKRSESNPQFKETTGDTILHIMSRMSDVIKSSGNLDAFLSDRKKVVAIDERKSYMGDIMVHPSKFIRDIDINDEDPEDIQPRPQSRQVRSHGNQLGLSNTIILEDHEYDVLRGSRLIINCKFPPNITFIALWKDYEVSSYTVNPLEFDFTTSSHNGLWICEGKRSDGKKIGRYIRISIIEAPTAPYLEVFGKRLDSSNSFLPIKEGSELHLTCRSEGGDPPPELEWSPLVPGLKVPFEEIVYNENERVWSTGAKLTVRRSHHNMTVGCIARHRALSSNAAASILLHVQYAPRFGISRVPGFGFPLIEGQPVSLKCEVDSNPPAGPSWRKDDQDPPVGQGADGFLNFTSIQREHSGWYKCTASHALGNYSSIGYFLNVRYEVDSTQEPEFQQPATGSKVEALGGAVHLQCPEESTGCWGQSSNSQIKKSGTKSSGDLQIQGLLFHKNGEYQCQGLSELEAETLKVLKETTLVVTGGPIAYAQSPNYTAFHLEDETAQFQAIFCANPPPSKVFWIAGGHVLHPGTTHRTLTAHNIVNSTKDCHKATLIVGEVKLSDAGEYALVVRSPQGLAEVVFQLAVQVSPSRQRHSSSTQIQPHYIILLLVPLFTTFHFNC